jgi:hypothetical protein
VPQTQLAIRRLEARVGRKTAFCDGFEVLIHFLLCAVESMLIRVKNIPEMGLRRLYLSDLLWFKFGRYKVNQS